MNGVRKRPRNRRKPVGGFVLTDRDRRLFRALARFRIARTADLRRVVFPDVHRDTAGERLRKLFDAGFLDVQVGDRSDENQYTLGPKAKAWLRAQGIEPGRVPSGDRAHHLAIVRLWALLVESVRALPDTQIERTLPDWELRSLVPGLSPIPDLFLLLRHAQNDKARTLPIAIEVDLGTEPVGTIRAKVERYEIARLGPDGFLGLSDFHLAVFAPVGTGRIASIRSAIDARWTERWSVWSQEGEVASGIRSLVDGPEAPRTDSPYGTGRASTATSDNATPSDLDDAGL